MTEQGRASQKRQGEAEREPHRSQTEAQPALEQFHEWGQGILPYTETPFQPQIDRDADLLARLHPYAHARRLASGVLLQLQQTYGNRYAQSLLASRAVQAKLRVNPPDDQYEREADRIADAATRAPVSQVQREDEEEEIQAKGIDAPLPRMIQRQPEEEEEQGEEELQAKRISGIQRKRKEEDEELQTQPARGQPGVAHETTHVVQRGVTDSGAKPADREARPGILGGGGDAPVGLQAGQREISTPLGEYVEEVPKKKAATFKIGQTNVVVRHDRRKAKGIPAKKAKTIFRIKADMSSVKVKVKKGKITEITGSPKIALTIQTLYGKKASPGMPSAYGRGPTLGEHEGAHGTDYIEYLKANPPPGFAGEIGMTTKQYNKAVKKFNKDVKAYASAMKDYSMQQTDCVGVEAEFCPAHEGTQKEEGEEGKVQKKAAGSQIEEGVQRQPEEEEEEIRAKGIDAPLPRMTQRQPEEEEEKEDEQVQTAATDSLLAQGIHGGQPDSALDSLETRINAKKGSGQRLPDPVRAMLEPRLGMDLSEVRVHADAEADALSRQLGARAFTTGHDIFFRESDYQPGSVDGQRLISHELAHVAQQTGGGAPLAGEEAAEQTGASSIQRVQVGETLPQLSDVSIAATFPSFKDQWKKNIWKRLIYKKTKEAFQRAVAKTLWNPVVVSRNDSVVARDLFIDAVTHSADIGDAYELAAKNLTGTPNPNAIYVLDELYDETTNIKSIAEATRSYYPHLAARESRGLPAQGPKVGKILGPAKRKEFAEALRSMPAFKEFASLTQGSPIWHELKKLVKSQIEGGKPEPQLAEWKDRGSLIDKITSVPADHPSLAASAHYYTGRFHLRVAEADLLIKRIVEPGLLGKIPRPEIVAHLMVSSDDDPKGFRAECGDGVVDVAQSDSREIIVHEIGHHLEDNLTDKEYERIAALLTARHAEAGGGAAVPVDPNEPITKETEARYPGDYPATDPYTARAYSFLGTEVASMTMQFLSEPGKIQVMLETDPQQVAVVLRALRPDEYAAHAPLEPFNQFLP